MKISGIDFPSALLSALNDSKLVVFAGAGVSKGEPASLPDFQQLALEIAKGTGKTLADGEPEDRFLGRLQQAAVDVHARAAEILQLNTRGNTPRPNSLHTDLVLLYSQSLPLRLVTTNFDLLFEDAANHRFASPPERFTAPALPLGHDFEGIVHIHGSIDRPPSMVLTDVDFGRAYLTEGWSRRFLLQLFRSFTVLFVGYSHQDTVMHYLSRSLPARDSQPRFALVKDDETEVKRWDRLGIHPVPFPTLPGNSYGALYAGVHALAQHATLGLLGWQHRIVELARQPPPLDEEHADLVDAALTDRTRTRFFTRVATDPAWIQWLDARGHFPTVFGSAELPDPQVELARWLAQTFARNHPRDLFLLIARHHTRLHPVLWYELSRSIGSKQDPPLPEDVLSRWVSLLVATATVPLDALELFRLAKRCAEQKLFHHMIKIFDALIAPRMTLLQRVSSPLTDDADPLQRVDMQLTFTSSSEHWIRKFWQELARPRLQQLAVFLLPRVADRLTTRHETHRDWRKADRNYDSEAFRRHAIEPHAQDEFPSSADVLIDAARDCLEYLVEHIPEIAARWCDECANSDVPLLRRLTVHTLFVREDLSSNEKCDWLLRHLNIHDRAAHHEMFRIAHSIYPALDQARRRELIQAVLAYEYPGDRDKRHHTAGHHFDWFEWLLRADPDCPLLAQQLQRIRDRYPRLEPRRHPDLTHYVSEVMRIGDKTPWSTEQLLARSAAQWVDDLIAFEPTDRLGPSRGGLLLSVEEAATRQFDWGIELSDALIDDSQWDSDLWTALLRAWSKSELNDQQRQRVLERLRSADLREAQVVPIADFLCESHKPVPSPRLNESLDPANELAADMWDRLSETAPQANQTHDWLTQAINHPAGNLAQFWVYSLWHSANRRDPKPKSLGEQHTSALSDILQDQTVNGTLARTVLCRSFAFFLDIDESWTGDNLLPLFDIDSGQTDSMAAWCGFLYGNTTIPAIEAMKPKFLSATERLDTDFDDRGLTERFIEAYTYVLFFHVDDPLPAWIPRLLAHIDDEGRRYFAWHIGRNLRQIDGEQRVIWWERWLRPYWERRLQGIPFPLYADEVDSMLMWLPLLDNVFDQATDIAIRMPRLPLRDGFVLDEVIEANLHDAYPEAVAKLMDYLRHCHVSPTAWRQATDAINQLLQSNIPDALKTSLEEIIAELGPE